MHYSYTRVVVVALSQSRHLLDTIWKKYYADTIRRQDGWNAWKYNHVAQDSFVRDRRSHSHGGSPPRSKMAVEPSISMH